MNYKYIIWFLIIGIFLLFLGLKEVNKEGNVSDLDLNIDKEYKEEDVETIYLAGGCFWGIEEFYHRVDGVASSVSGYANGDTINPTYKEVSRGDTNHAETVEVKYNPKETDLKNLLIYYFKIIDPTTLNRQGPDKGTQYRSGIYYTKDSQLSAIEEVIEEEP